MKRHFLYLLISIVCCSIFAYMASISDAPYVHKTLQCEVIEKCVVNKMYKVAVKPVDPNYNITIINPNTFEEYAQYRLGETKNIRIIVDQNLGSQFLVILCILFAIGIIICILLIFADVILIQYNETPEETEEPKTHTYVNYIRKNKIQTGNV